MSDFIAVLLFIALAAGIGYMHGTSESDVKLCMGPQGIFLLEPHIERNLADFVDTSTMQCDTLHLTNAEISKLRSSLRHAKLN